MLLSPPFEPGPDVCRVPLDGQLVDYRRGAVRQQVLEQLELGTCSSMSSGCEGEASLRVSVRPAPRPPPLSFAGCVLPSMSIFTCTWSREQKFEDNQRAKSSVGTRTVASVEPEEVGASCRFMGIPLSSCRDDAVML